MTHAAARPVPLAPVMAQRRSLTWFASIVAVLISTACGGCGGGSSGSNSVPAPVTTQALILTMAGAGTVTSSPAGVQCTGSCTANFSTGTSVTLTAQPASGYSFTGWTGACSGTAACVVALSSTQSVVATFTSNAPNTNLVMLNIVGSGTVSSNPAGIQCSANCSAAFPAGSSVTLSAQPASGYSFSGWGGACSGTTTCTVVMSATQTMTANFAANPPPPGNQTLSLNIAGSGTVTSSPSGINCTSSCTASFTTGTTVNLSAQAATGYTFAGWSGACTGAAGCAVVMSAAETATATFVSTPPPNQTLNLTISGSGTVTSSPAGVNCTASCAASFASGTTVTLSAQPASGNTFSGWSGACSGTGTCTVLMSAAAAVTATFASTPPPNQTLTLNIAGSGTVTSSPAGINCTASCTASFAGGASVTLSAQPASGYTFAGWTGACSGTGSCVVQMSAAQTVTASFTTGGGPTAGSASTVGPYTVQMYTAGLPVTSHYVEPLVYYPSNAPTPMPAAVFVAGSCETYESRGSAQPQYFTQWGTFLASHGFVVLFVNTSSNGCGTPQSAALTDGLASLVGENTRSGSPLFGILDTQRLAVMGHSYGGSGAFYAAQANTNPGLKAVLAMNPVANNGYFNTDTTPSLIFAGVNDPHINTAANLAQYQSIPATTPSLYALFNPVSTVLISMHHIADTPLGTNVTDPIVARLGLSFLEVYVVGDARYAPFLVADPSMATFYRTP